MGTYTKTIPLQWLFFLLLSSFTLPAHATVTFRIFTAGAQAGEIHIDSPEGSFIYFREGFDSPQPADGFCGIRWVGEVEDLVWYWGNPGWMSYLPGNGAQVEKLAYVTAYSTCFTKLNASFETPCTPDGIAPPDALMLVVEVPGWQHVSFVNQSGYRLPLPERLPSADNTDICRRYPPFCRINFRSLPDNPCTGGISNTLICQTLPDIRLGLAQVTDLMNIMSGAIQQSEVSCLDNLYRRGGVKHIKKSIQSCHAQLTQAQMQFRSYHTSYRRLDAPLKQLNKQPFSHFTYAAASMHLDLADVWLERCQDQLAAIFDATENKQNWTPKNDFTTLQEYRQRAGHHLAEARFWLDRQQAWVLPMER